MARLAPPQFQLAALLLIVVALLIAIGDAQSQCPNWNTVLQHCPSQCKGGGCKQQTDSCGYSYNQNCKCSSGQCSCKAACDSSHLGGPTPPNCQTSKITCDPTYDCSCVSVNKYYFCARCGPQYCGVSWTHYLGCTACAASDVFGAWCDQSRRCFEC